jgi:formylglycine-generating enzyme required for sulfatase activity
MGDNDRSTLPRCGLPLGTMLAALALAIACGKKAGSRPGDMVHVPAASVSIGAEDGEPDERPVHEVSVAAFEIDRTEVSIVAYRACVKAGACVAPDAFHERCNLVTEPSAGTGAAGGKGTAAKEDNPVNCATWEMATKYCAWAGKRLPTEPEWEYAARGAHGTKYPWGNDPVGSQPCWNRQLSDGTCPVGSHPGDRSVFGAMDMAGSLSEWTSTPYCEYQGKPCKPDTRVTRGGSWDMKDSSYLRSTYRDWVLETNRGYNLGFRCARSAP